jgi:hypothetical protein
VPDRANRSSSLTVSLSTVAELLKGHADATVTNGVYWGTQLALVVALSHFLELGTKPELLRFRCNADLADDQVDSLLIWVCPASDLLALLVLPSVAHNPPDGVKE